MNATLVVAPHPDDETLGCGGTLLRYKAEGSRIGWLIVTEMTEADWSSEATARRAREIELVSRMFGFDEVFQLRLPTTRLDTIPMSDVIGRFADVFKRFEPRQVLVPHRSDIHTDHQIVFDAVAACTKWFRYPSVERVLAYETLSETDFALHGTGKFSPNCFVNIAAHLDRKIEIAQVYESEMSRFPFPRSVDALRALATLRGAAAGFEAAEAFELLRERR
jgi:LmbE family N-acetylglucosaminyl deacetylase